MQSSVPRQIANKLVCCVSFCSFSPLPLARSGAVTKAAWQEAATVIPHPETPPTEAKSDSYTLNTLSRDDTRRVVLFPTGSTRPRPPLTRRRRVHRIGCCLVLLQTNNSFISFQVVKLVTACSHVLDLKGYSTRLRSVLMCVVLIIRFRALIIRHLMYWSLRAFTYLNE